MPEDTEPSVVVSQPFEEAKIVDWPTKITVSADELAKRSRPIRLFNNPSWLKAIGNDQPKSEVFTNSMVTEWLPYLSNLVEKEVLKVNREGADIFMTQHGLYMVSPGLFDKFGDEIASKLEQVLASNSFTLARSPDTPYTQMIDTSSGEVLEGILLAVRMYINEEAIPNYPTLKLT